MLIQISRGCTVNIVFVSKSLKILVCFLLFFCLLNQTMAQSSLLKSSANKFSLRLHEVLRSEEGDEQNLFYSPSSILVALAMTYLGAGGNTAKQMITSFNLDEITEQQIKPAFHDFLESLGKSNTNGNHVAMANKLFAQIGFEIVQKFQEETNQYFNAQLGTVDYMKDAQGARKEVNEWVENQTNGKIQDLIPEGLFTQLTRLTLVNAIHFKGSWLVPFNAKSTRTGEFQVSANTKINIPLMYKSADFRYIEDPTLECQIVELPYAGEKLSMIVFLPTDMNGLSKLEKIMNYSRLDAALKNLKTKQPEEVEVTLPKFKLTSEFSLKDVLSKLGATDMFSQGIADFSGISAEGQLFVSEVVHKAFVDVNEEGTEAAAATAIGIALMCLPMNPVFYANHPFLFIIQHNESGAILFMGRVAKPQQ